MTNESAKQLKSALKAKFGRSFCVRTHGGPFGDTHTIYAPLSRMDRAGFSTAESKELGDAMGFRDFETQFVVPDVMVADVLANLGSSAPTSLIAKRSNVLAGRA